MSSGNQHHSASSRGLHLSKKSRGEKEPMEAHPSAQAQVSTFDSEFVSCSQAIFVGCRDGVWWKVPPTEDKVGDVETALGVPWSLVMHVMMFHRLLCS